MRPPGWEDQVFSSYCPSYTADKGVVPSVMVMVSSTSDIFQISLVQCDEIHYQEAQKHSDLLQNEAKSGVSSRFGVLVHFGYLSRKNWLHHGGV